MVEEAIYKGKSKIFRRSLFVVKDTKKREVFIRENVRFIRSGYELPPKYLKDILGKKTEENIKRGTPLNWNLVK